MHCYRVLLQLVLWCVASVDVGSYHGSGDFLFWGFLFLGNSREGEKVRPFGTFRVMESKAGSRCGAFGPTCVSQNSFCISLKCQL